ncbi:hypothetical protein HDU96_007505 [Phlyctochytrium bullatum]|nr:hypothetical protein HDU96_007505 [Phlyctochytrium bullatum]
MEATATSPRPRKRRSRKSTSAAAGDGDFSETSSVADDASVTSSQLEEFTQDEDSGKETEGRTVKFDVGDDEDDDEKENLPDIRMRPGTPWSFNVKRFVAAMSPTKLFFQRSEETEVSLKEEDVVDVAAEVEDELAADAGTTQEVEDAAPANSSILEEFEEYKTVELEEGEIEEEDDADARIRALQEPYLPKTGPFAWVSETPMGPIVSSIVDSGKLVLSYVKVPLVLLFDWIILPPFQILAAILRPILFTTYGQIALISALAGLIFVVATDKLELGTGYSLLSNETFKFLPVFQLELSKRLAMLGENFDNHLETVVNATQALAAGISSFSSLSFVASLNQSSMNVFTAKQPAAIVHPDSWTLFLPLRMTWNPFGEIWGSGDGLEAVANGTSLDTSKISKRLQKLEQKLDDIVRRISKGDGAVAGLVKAVGDAASQRSDLYERMRKLGERLEESLDAHSQYENTLAKSIGGSLSSIRAEVAALTKSLQENVKSGEVGRKDVETVREALGRLEGRVTIVEKRAPGLSEDEVKKRILELIKQHVPSMLVASVDGRSKQVTMDPTFLMHLRKQFAPKDVTEEVKSLELKLQDELKARKASDAANGGLIKKLEADLKKVSKSSGTSSAAKPASVSEDQIKKIVKQEISSNAAPKVNIDQIMADTRSEIDRAVKQAIAIKADAATVESLLDDANFLKVNRHRIEEILKRDDVQMAEEKATAGKPKPIILTKEETLALVEAELDRVRGPLRNEIEAFLLEASKEISQSTVVEAMKEEHDKLIKSIPALDSKAEAERERRNEEKLKSLAEKMIREALRKYSADVVARPDYALGTAGAQILPLLTSSNLREERKNIVAKFFGLTKPRGFGPQAILSPTTSPGYCWSMEGSIGQVGVRLVRPVVPHAFTLDHMKADLAYGSDKSTALASAPKDVELWAVYDVITFRSLDTNLPATRSIKPTAEPPAALLLAVQRFDPRGGEDVQTFPVRKEAVDRMEHWKAAKGVSPEVVVLRILSQEVQVDLKKYIEREVEILREVRHPNVVQFMGCCTHEGKLLLVTEFVAGGNVKEVCDFGFSRPKPKTAAEVRRLSFCGTDTHMAPEIILGMPFDNRVDVFSYGVVLCELALRTAAVNNPPRFPSSDSSAKIAWDGEGSEEGAAAANLKIRIPSAPGSEAAVAALGRIVPGFGLEAKAVRKAAGLPKIAESNNPNSEVTWDNIVEVFVSLALSCCDEEPQNRPSWKEILASLRAMEKVAEREEPGHVGVLYDEDLDAEAEDFSSLEDIIDATGQVYQPLSRTPSARRETRGRRESFGFHLGMPKRTPSIRSTISRDSPPQHNSTTTKQPPSFASDTASNAAPTTDAARHSLERDSAGASASTDIPPSQSVTSLSSQTRGTGSAGNASEPRRSNPSSSIRSQNSFVKPSYDVDTVVRVGQSRPLVTVTPVTVERPPAEKARKVTGNLGPHRFSIVRDIMMKRCDSCKKRTGLTRHLICDDCGKVFHKKCGRLATETCEASMGTPLASGESTEHVASDDTLAKASGNLSKHGSAQNLTKSNEELHHTHWYLKKKGSKGLEKSTPSSVADLSSTQTLGSSSNTNTSAVSKSPSLPSLSSSVQSKTRILSQ